MFEEPSSLTRTQHILIPHAPSPIPLLPPHASSYDIDKIGMTLDEWDRLLSP